jgi:dipeptidyl aminopeptidase/acylaminoacyl peptidase
MGARLAVAVGVLILAGCAGDDGDSSADPTTSPGEPTAAEPTSPEVTDEPSAPTSSDSPADPSAAAPPVPDPVSLPALMARDYDGRGLRVGDELLRTDAYTRYAVTYRSGDLRISGIMNVPDGRGPFPALVLNHGYIDPAYYVTGQGLAREQDYLAREGYVVLHTDYRNHAGSDNAPVTERRLRLGYTTDVINAVLAIKRSELPYLDGERVGLLGRSMGGGVTYNALVVQPGLVDAAVVYASVSTRTADNFNRWIRGERDQLSRQIIDEYGSPERNPEFWRGVSPYTYLDRVTEPILVHHGTIDHTCPLRWTHRTVDELRRLGKDVRLRLYEGEGHTFYSDWTLSMRRSVAFFDRELN